MELVTYSHAERTAKVVQDDPRAGIARVIHCRRVRKS